MKTKSFLAALFLCSIQVFAQHPLVGTWQMVSAKGTGTDGNKFSLDSTTVRETKIITPTHYMLIQQNVKGDSITFHRCDAGTISMKGNKYLEFPERGSENLNPVKTDFTWKVDGDKFIQAGSFTLSDGKKVVIDELVFQRVHTKNAYPKNPGLGVWDQLSSSYSDSDGKSNSHTKKTATRYEIVTPTHWIRISHLDKKFENVMGGSYTMKGDKFYPAIDFASFAIDKVNKAEATQEIKGNKRIVNGSIIAPDGTKVFTWNDVFEKVVPVKK